MQDEKKNDIGCFETENITRYEKLDNIGEGTYGTVFRARDKRTGEIVAIKKIHMDTKRTGFPLTSTREINILKSISRHTNIVYLRDVCVGNSSDSVFLVFEYCEQDMATLVSVVMKFTSAETKRIMLQILSAIAHLHDNFIMHRDLKLSNLLMDSNGVVKVADFGLARRFGIPLKNFTPRVVTLWYRAPEVLLGGKEYHAAIDMWAIGCMFAEFLTGSPLIMGNSEISQIELMFKLLGTPNEKIWPGFSQLRNVHNLSALPVYQYNNLTSKFSHMSPNGVDLLSRLLTYDPSKRITAARALKHPYFSEHPYPVSDQFLSRFSSKNTHASDDQGDNESPRKTVKRKYVGQDS